MPVPGAGAYKVGCADIMTTRDGGDGIFARIFYPIESESSVYDLCKNLSIKSTCFQLPEPSSLPVWVPRREYLDGLAAYKKMSRHQLHFAFDWFVGDYRIPANWHAVPIASKDLPILVFSHGLSACRHFYSTFCTAIASHGYVVAAIEHRSINNCVLSSLFDILEMNRHVGRISWKKMQMVHGSNDRLLCDN
jgi:platelet-activating factor acetylhydrolase